ncbi:MAG: hypothetical protein ABIA47_04065 [bacterium]
MKWGVKLAQDLTSQVESAGAAIYGTGDVPSLATMTGTVINVLFSLLGVTLLVLLIYGGVLWMTAGSSDRVKKAKDIIINAVIGLVITAGAYAVAQFVVQSLGLE